MCAVPSPSLPTAFNVLYAGHACWTEVGEFRTCHLWCRANSTHHVPLCVFEMDGHGAFHTPGLWRSLCVPGVGAQLVRHQLLHNWITLHSAVLERDGRAVILPGATRLGQEARCAALMLMAGVCC